MSLSSSSKAAHQAEDAANLVLGDEFQNEQTLSTSELFFLLEKIKTAREDDQSGGEQQEMLDKTLEYSRRFVKFSSSEQVQDARKKLEDEKLGLQQFEVAALLNLVPDEVDEAKTLIPSLKDKMDDVMIEEVLQDLDV